LTPLDEKLEESLEESVIRVRCQNNQAFSFLTFSSFQSQRMSWHQKNFNEERQQQEEENAEPNQAYHCHGYSHAYEDRKKEQHQARRKLYTASVICIIFMVAEITGEFLKFIEILGALMSMIIIWMVTGVLTYSASVRLLHPDYDIDATAMLITSACAVLANTLLSLILHQTGHGHSHGKRAGETMLAPLEKPALSNTSLRAAFVHAVGDLFQSISVLISALIIFFKPEYKIADPICTLVFSIFVLATTITILRDILIVLMEGTEKGLTYDAVKARILAVEKVESVHNLHLWSLTMNQTILSAHVATAEAVDSQKTLKDITQALSEHYSFHSITIQIESREDQKQNCVFCQEPRD
ncbi:hypothetical protein ASZ78_006813, partial [Callipepla squamata]